MFSFGKTPMTLVIARGLQGASASVIWVVGLALLSDTMGASNCGEAMGWQGVGRFVGALLGPSLGGIVYDFAGHYAVFGMAFAVLLFDIVLRFAMIERKVAEQWISFPETISYHATDSTDSLGDERPQSPCDILKSPATEPSRNSLSDILGGHATGVGLLLSSSRILAALWTYFACSVIMTALESVSFL
jgi:MFS family permease